MIQHLIIFGLSVMVRILSINEQIKGIEYKSQDYPLKKRRDSCKEFKIQLAKDIAKRALIELGVGLAFAAVACLFVATPAGMATLLICAVATVAINILLRTGSAYCMYRLFLLKYKESENAEIKRTYFLNLLNFLRYLVPGVFSTLVDANTRDLIVHEGGHALAAHILIKNPRTKITIVPTQGGQTSYRIGALTKIGEFFGRNKSKLIIAAAGPAAAVVTATFTLGVSLSIRKSNPELSRYLKVIAVDSIAQQAFYALSALWVSATNKGHDFLQLMAGGIHPAVAVIAIVALPIIVRIGFFIYDKVKEIIKEREANQFNKIGLAPYNRLMREAQAA